MKAAHLTDLDELALNVRDETARSYILEAIVAYRGGAYRASIISTWIAVGFDIISKIRELAAQDNKQAKDFINNLDQAIASNNKKRLQDIEGNLLKDAKNDFEFISEQEAVDFHRLKEDRNLCAHPVFISGDILFEPEPERVRMHIVHSIKHLLQHQPVQGKSAISRIKRDIKSNAFPLSEDEAYSFLNTRYLDRAKKVLVGNLIILLLKALLHGDIPDLPLTYSKQILLTLKAISKRYPDIYQERMKAKFPTILESLTEDKLLNSFRLLSVDPDLWRWLDESTKIHLKGIISISLNQPWIPSYIFDAMSIDELKPIIIKLFEELPLENKIFYIKRTLHPEFSDQAISIYSSVNGYRTAESLGESLILPMSSYFSVNDIRKFLKVVQENKQIWDASGTPRILANFLDKTRQNLPYLHEDWKSFFSFLFTKYSASSTQFERESNVNFWSETIWEILASKLKDSGVSLPPEN